MCITTCKWVASHLHGLQCESCKAVHAGLVFSKLSIDFKSTQVVNLRKGAYQKVLKKLFEVDELGLRSDPIWLPEKCTGGFICCANRLHTVQSDKLRSLHDSGFNIRKKHLFTFTSRKDLSSSSQVLGFWTWLLFFYYFTLTLFIISSYFQNCVLIQIWGKKLLSQWGTILHKSTKHDDFIIHPFGFV